MRVPALLVSAGGCTRRFSEEGRNKTRGTCFGRRRPNHERREARVLAGVKSTP